MTAPSYMIIFNFSFRSSIGAAPLTPKEPQLDAFSAFQTPFDFPREAIEEIERRRPGSTAQTSQRRPPLVPQVPQVPQR